MKPIWKPIPRSRRKRVPFRVRASRSFPAFYPSGYRVEDAKMWQYFDGHLAQNPHRVLRDEHRLPIAVAQWREYPDSLVLFSIQREYPTITDRLSHRSTQENVKHKEAARHAYARARQQLEMDPARFMVMDFLQHFRSQIVDGKKCYFQPEFLLGYSTESATQRRRYAPLIRDFFQPTVESRMINDHGDGKWRRAYLLDFSKPLVRYALGLLPLMRVKKKIPKKK